MFYSLNIRTYFSLAVRLIISFDKLNIKVLENLGEAYTKLLVQGSSFADFPKTQNL